MRVDLHNHTTLCNHATGTMEEYIQKAIEIGIDVYGFSDHAPMPFDPKYRMDISLKSSYEKSIEELQEKYKNSIEILKAYEVDFMQNSSLMLDEILTSKVDFLIGSVHFLQEKNSELWGFDNPEFIGKYKEKDIDLIWSDYFTAIKELAKSRLFDIVGHLDLIKLFKYLPKKDIKLLAKDALKEIKKANMVIEINAAGLRKPINEPYPSKELLELAFELDIPITFSSDAHSVEQVGFMYDEVKSFAKSVGYTKCATFKNRAKELVIF
ncbi:histidinol-phosphatase HisJ [Halarcobacter ebronensis]|uniref:Histidinol-phosphatase n=1 Tax=Halarcobacter ebronensis TaxID=1462615 RepID=A0A4Q1AGR8_9BACT|nr:histidinol-phosphatase HisJ [Halarcobacter ebronensis]QKF83001.1 histidinol-phosphate phosphatase [Halarcobacter ebronensis]RXK02801.1 histidinol phosphate phosphatase [Halarcobacter ebronensis]